MYDVMRDGYLSGELSDDDLDTAVEWGWITPEEREQIKSEKAGQQQPAQTSSGTSESAPAGSDSASQTESAPAP